MTRAILFLAFLLIANYIFQWRLTQWKISEIKSASEQIEKKLDHVSSELDTIIEQYTKDPEAWQRIKSQLK